MSGEQIHNATMMYMSFASAATESVLQHKNKWCCGLGAEWNLFLNYPYSCASHSMTPLCLRKLKTQSPPPQGMALQVSRAGSANLSSCSHLGHSLWYWNKNKTRSLAVTGRE